MGSPGGFFYVCFRNKTFDSRETQKIKTSGLWCPFVLAGRDLEQTKDDCTVINNATSDPIIPLVFLAVLNTRESMNAEMVSLCWLLAKRGKGSKSPAASHQQPQGLEGSGP